MPYVYEDHPAPEEEWLGFVEILEEVEPEERLHRYLIRAEEEVPFFTDVTPSLFKKYEGRRVKLVGKYGNSTETGIYLPNPPKYDLIIAKSIECVKA